MSDFPASQSQTSESIAIIQAIRSLKQSATDRATAFGIVTTIAQDAVESGARTGQLIGQSTKDQLEMAKGMPDSTVEGQLSVRQRFEQQTLEAHAKMTNANVLVSETAAKLASRV